MSTGTHRSRARRQCCRAPWRRKSKAGNRGTEASGAERASTRPSAATARSGAHVRPAVGDSASSPVYYSLAVRTCLYRLAAVKTNERINGSRISLDLVSFIHTRLLPSFFRKQPREGHPPGISPGRWVLDGRARSDGQSGKFVCP